MKPNLLTNIQCKLVALGMAICALFPFALQAQDTPIPQTEVGEGDIREYDITQFQLKEDGGQMDIPEASSLKIPPQLTTSGFYVVDEAYYSQFTYKWTDSNNKVHTSKLTDRATDVNQMIRLIEEVYTNPLIPGYRIDISTYNSDNRGKLIYCPYYPMKFGPYCKDEPEATPTTPPIVGATVLLVELKDEYTGDYDDNLEKNWEQAFNDIKAIRIITQQMHVGEGTGTANPGYLFKVNAELNKFFIISKGYNRIKQDGVRLEADHLRKLYPFYDYFEEFSPTNKPDKVVVNGYQRMMNGEQFAVNHNCSTVMEQRHDMVMSESTTSHNSYIVSQGFFLPDLRFNGDTQNLYENGELSSDNWKSDEYYSYYAEGQRPYFFINIIKANIDNIEATPKVDDNGALYSDPVKVDLSWTSTYKLVIGANVPEEFMIYRVVDGVIEDYPIPYNEFSVTQDGTTLIPADADGNILFADDNIDETTGTRPLISQEDIDNKTYGEAYGVVVRSADRNVTVTIIEPPMTQEGRKVEYIVYGRRHMGLGIEANYSNFTFSTSNYVEGNIEGLASSEVIGLAIDGSSLSTADILGQQNHYRVKINLVDYRQDPTSNLTHSMITEGTEMIIKRYSNIASEEGVIVGKINILESQHLGGGTQGWENMIYFGSITDYKDGVENTRFDYDKDKFREAKPEDLAILRADIKNESDESLQKITTIDNRSDATNKKYVLATIIDEFSVDVQYADHPAEYTYRLEFNSAAVVDGVKTANAGEHLISNPAEFNVIKRDLYVGYLGYTEDEIRDDINAKELLPPNQLGVAVGVRTNANIKNYEFYAVNDDNTAYELIGRLTRFPDGSFRCDAFNEETGKMVTTSEGTKGNYGGKLPIPLLYSLDEGQDVSLVVNYNSGSSFTSMRTALIPLPTVDIEEVSIKYDKEADNKHWYNVGISAKGDNLNGHTLHKVLGDNGKDNYGRTIYGIWSVHDEEKDGGFTTVDHPGKENVVNPQQNRSGRKALRAADEDNGTTVNYDFNSADQPGGQDNPFTMYHKVRLYAQLPTKALIGSPTQTTGYVVADTEGVHGIYTKEDGTTTGVEDVEASQQEAPTIYFNLQGIQVDIETAAPGIYIRVCGATSDKIVKH